MGSREEANWFINVIVNHYPCQDRILLPGHSHAFTLGKTQIPKFRTSLYESLTERSRNVSVKKNRLDNSRISPGVWFRCKFQYHYLCLCSATLRVAGSLQKSTEVMQAMQSLIHVPEVAATMRDLSREMMRVSYNVASDAYNESTVLIWQWHSYVISGWLHSCYFRIVLGLLQGIWVP